MLLDLLELASNKTLEHDPKTKQRLIKLRGKTMSLQIRPIDQSLSITPHPEGLEFSREEPAHVDVSLSATIGAMIKISRDGLENAELESGELEITGDPIIGQRFAQILAELDVDWEAALAEQIGDSPARVVSFAADQAKELVQDSRVMFKGFVNQILSDDLGVAAGKNDVEPFLDEVDTIRADVERLAARIKRISNNLD